MYNSEAARAGDVTKHQSEQDREDYDSDATVGLDMTPKKQSDYAVSDGSSTSVETVYDLDPDYTGPVPQSQPCQKRGICYTPEGWKKTYQKKRKLAAEFDDK